MDALAELYLDNVGAPHDAAAAQLRQDALEEPVFCLRGVLRRNA